MSNDQLLYPMAALVLLTFCVAVVMLRRRIAAARNRQVKVNDFRIYQFGDDVPETMITAARNFSNLFETPVLFYAVCLSAMVLGTTDLVMVVMAWAYVVIRYFHSYIHVTHNTVLVRMRVFAVSLLVLLAMWIWTVVRAAGIA